MTASTARKATATRTATKRAPAKRTSPADVTPAKITAKAPAAKAPAKRADTGRGTTLERLTAPVPTDAAELADHIGTARWAIRRAVKSGNADLQLLAETRLAQLLKAKAARKVK